MFGTISFTACTVRWEQLGCGALAFIARWLDWTIEHFSPEITTDLTSNRVLRSVIQPSPDAHFPALNPGKKKFNSRVLSSQIQSPHSRPGK